MGALDLEGDSRADWHKWFPRKKERNNIARLSIDLLNPALDDVEALEIWRAILRVVLAKNADCKFGPYRPPSPEDAILAREQLEDKTRTQKAVIRDIRFYGIEEYFDRLPSFLKDFIKAHFWEKNGEKYGPSTVVNYESKLFNEHDAFNQLFCDIIITSAFDYSDFNSDYEGTFRDVWGYWP